MKTIIFLSILMIFNNIQAQDELPSNPDTVVSSTLAEWVTKGKTPSVQYAFFTGDEVLYSESIGHSDIRKDKTVDESTQYALFSVTKTITTLAVLKLVEDGKIDLHASLKNYLPNHFYSSQITPHHLLTHTSGIPNPLPISWIHLESEHDSFDSRSFFDSVMRRHAKLKSKPGEKFNYSNLNFVLLGQLIEAVGEQDYQTFVEENVIKSIGFKFNDFGYNIKFDTLCIGHHPKHSFSGALLKLFLNTHKYIASSSKHWLEFEPCYMNGMAYGGAFGNQVALIQYIQNLLNEEHLPISKPYIDLMFSENQTTNGKSTQMCLSWFKGELNRRTYYTHAGGGGGYYCEVRLYRDLGYGSILIMNASGFKDSRLLDTLDIHFLPKK